MTDVNKAKNSNTSLKNSNSSEIDVEEIKLETAPTKLEILGMQLKYGILSQKTDAAMNKDENVTKKRKRGRPRKTRKSDPIVNNISELISASLNIKSPERNDISLVTVKDDKEFVNEVEENSNQSITIVNENESNELEKEVLKDAVELDSECNKKKDKKRRKYRKKLMNQSSNQSSLNSFLQITSSKEENESTNSSVRISSNLFMSPRMKKKLESKKENTVQQTEVEDLNEPATTSDKKVTFARKVKICSESNDSLVESDKIATTPKKNIFHMMMDNRNRVIGRNSPGKDLNSSDLNISDDTKTKEQLDQRKRELENWNNKKGAVKRKLDDETRDEQIADTLDKRKKRLKMLLNGEEDMPIKKRKKVKRIESSPESSLDSVKDEASSILEQEIIIEDTMDDEAFKKTHPISAVSNETPNNLLNVFDLFKPKHSKSPPDEPRKLSFGKKRKSLSLNNKNAANEKEKEEIVINDLTNLTNDESSESNKQEVEIKSTMDAGGMQLRRSTRNRASIIYSEDVEIVSETKPTKSTKKVAPVFAKSVAKPKIDPAVLEARRNFLLSGVPDNLKRMMQKQQSIEQIEYDLFPKISHVHQKDDSKLWNLPSVDLKLIDTAYQPKYNDIHLSLITKCALNDVNTKITLEPLDEKLQIKNILKIIKEENPNCPVYKFFRLLREKNGIVEEKPKNEVNLKRKSRKSSLKTDNDCAESQPVEATNDSYVMWTDKYKPKSIEDIIGNQNSLRELKSWLKSWLAFSQEINSSRKRRDSSDFESTDGDSRDSWRTPGNAMILRGLPGSGKTSALYAICDELNINVLELNASSKRTGKRLFQELSEATKSHQVRKDEKNAFSNFLMRKEDQQQQSNRMCLVLVEDVDIVFEQDEGFIGALNQLLITSKRPIVLITTHTYVQHLQKLITQYPVLTFSALSGKTFTIWLQILCLVEGLYVDESALGQLLEWNKGDARRTLLQLQFWLKSGGEALRSNDKSITLFKQIQLKFSSDDYNYDEESDETVSVIENAEIDQQPFDRLHENCLSSFLVQRNDIFSLPYPTNLAYVWWNLPNILNNKQAEHKNGEKSNAASDVTENLMKYARVFDALSLSDVLNRSEGVDNEMEPCYKSHETKLLDNLNFKDNIDEYKTDRSLLNDLTHTLIEGNCNLARNDAHVYLNMSVPPADETRSRITDSVCHETFLNAISISGMLDRNAFATDYFPTLRTIARNETIRASNNRKRGNRFYNYLRTLNIDTNQTIIKKTCSMFK